ncbi:MAG: glycine dehydrogenase (aminomethyl-transferring), partial [Chloroflexia bacterium]
MRPEPPATTFERRHIGPSPNDIEAMLATVRAGSLDALISETVPGSIRQASPLAFGPALSETAAIARMREIASKNQVFTSLIGAGYHNTLLPFVIQRNILESPAWYTAYTPYQPEISQGRLEALLNYQTMICDLTGLDVSNASLLDEATAAAEAMTLAQRVTKSKSTAFFVDSEVHPQTLALIQTRAEALDWTVISGNPFEDLAAADVFGAIFQYPSTHGEVSDFTSAIATIQAKGGIAVVA